MRGSRRRRDRPLRHGAQRRITCERALAGWDDDGPCTAIGHARTPERGGRRLRQRHRGAWRGFRRHLRGRSGACRRRHRAGGARGLRAAQSGRRGGAARHRGRRRDDVPAEPRGAEGGAQGGLPSDRGVRRDGRRRPASRRRLGSSRSQIVDALGIAGSMASGIIEYLAEGAWTKRMHAGWAAQSGLRAALLARAGFIGPRTVFEGTHGLFHGFAHTHRRQLRRADRRFRQALGDRDARVQALSVRDHDASLSSTARGGSPTRGITAGGYQGHRLRRRRGHRASAVGAARRQADVRQRLCGQILARPTASRRRSCAAMSASAISPTTP